jgi:prophage antirepressor-like protein
MNDLQIFENPEFGQVRTVELDGTPWLVGKDVAVALGYAKPQNAIARHVDTDDQKVAPIQGTPGGEQAMLIINESGLYSLILSSKMPKAKTFKHWVTSEVLPALRRNGVYETVKAQQHIEQLEATNERLTAAIQAVSTAKEQLAEVTDLRNDFIKHRDDYKARFIQAKANYGKICDSLRQAEGLVQRAQAELDSRIDQLKIVAFGLPAFDQILADIFTTEKKE